LSNERFKFSTFDLGQRVNAEHISKYSYSANASAAMIVERLFNVALAARSMPSRQLRPGADLAQVQCLIIRWSRQLLS
jgi:hypothetical protein